MSRQVEILAFADLLEAAPDDAEAARILTERFAVPAQCDFAAVMLKRSSLITIIRDLATWPCAYVDGSGRDPSEQ